MIEERVAMSSSDGASYNLHSLIVRAHTTAADLRVQSVTGDESDAESDGTSSLHALAESLSGDLSQGTLDFSSMDGFSSEDTQRSPSEHSDCTLTSPPGSPSFGQYNIATSTNHAPASSTDNSNAPTSHLSSSIRDARVGPTHTLPHASPGYAPVKHASLDPSPMSLTSHDESEGDRRMLQGRDGSPEGSVASMTVGLGTAQGTNETGRVRGGGGPLRLRRERASAASALLPPTLQPAVAEPHSRADQSAAVASPRRARQLRRKLHARSGRPCT